MRLEIFFFDFLHGDAAEALGGVGCNVLVTCTRRALHRRSAVSAGIAPSASDAWLARSAMRPQ